ncbi:MAG TPA: hypothetical protein VFX10_07240 [Nitrospira sp.]|nr:hypothetical protein [Nitrospira sp.]
MNTVKAGISYCAVVLAGGWVLGPVREFWVIPLVGQTTGLLLEIPLMLIVMIAAARWNIETFHISSAMMPRLTMGFIDLGLLLIAEVVGVLWVRRLSLAEYLQPLVLSPVLSHSSWYFCMLECLSS